MTEQPILFLLDSAKAAEYLSLKSGYLAQLRCKGNGPKYIRVGKYVRYSPRDLEEWVNNLRRINSTAASN